jgi:hypothetical protein
LPSPRIYFLKFFFPLVIGPTGNVLIKKGFINTLLTGNHAHERTITLSVQKIPGKQLYKGGIAGIAGIDAGE